MLIYHYRDIGHLAADLDPLGTKRPAPEQLTLEWFGLSEADLDERFDPGTLPLNEAAPLRDIIEVLKDTYCRHIGVEYMHIQNPEQRRWLRSRMETVWNRPAVPHDQKIRILRELAEAEGHHPDISFGWGYCTVVFYTHKIKGLHENDFIMAAKVNELV